MMKVLSNVEFEKLVEDQSSRLRSMARIRCDGSPKGFLYLEDLNGIMLACKTAGDHGAFKWLSNLKVLATSGKLQQLRRGVETPKDRKIYVHHLHAQGKIPFDLNDSVALKDGGKRGKVIDYIPSDDVYVVVFDPFQFKRHPAKELQKIAKKVKADEDQG
jgi:hypothetical protein